MHKEAQSQLKLLNVLHLPPYLVQITPTTTSPRKNIYSFSQPLMRWHWRFSVSCFLAVHRCCFNKENIWPFNPNTCEEIHTCTHGKTKNKTKTPRKGSLLPCRSASQRSIHSNLSTVNNRWEEKKQKKHEWAHSLTCCIYSLVRVGLSASCTVRAMIRGSNYTEAR